MKYFAKKLIDLYKLAVSPLLGANCRFLPSCSEYCKQAIDEYGVVKGAALGIKRISRCHPFGKAGIDNVPKK